MELATQNRYELLRNEDDTEPSEAGRSSVCTMCEQNTAHRHYADGATLTMPGCQLHSTVLLEERIRVFRRYRPVGLDYLALRARICRLLVLATAANLWPLEVGIRVHSFLFSDRTS